MAQLAQPTLVDYTPDEIAGMERRLLAALADHAEAQRDLKQAQADAKAAKQEVASALKAWEAAKLATDDDDAD